MNTFKHIFFDLDGTLVNSSKGIKKAFDYAFTSLDLETPTDKVLDTFIGPPLEVSLATVLPESDVEKAIAYFREYYREKGVYETELYSGVKELLDALREHGLSVYITTSKNEPMAHKMLEHLQVHQLFDGIFGSLPDSYHKADVLTRALNSHQIPLAEAVIIGDTKFDMIGGKEVGLTTLGILWGFGKEVDLVENGADLIAQTPQDVFAILTK